MSESSLTTNKTSSSSSEQTIQEIFKITGPLCNSEGFYQHTGQCWSDAVQMIMLYQDGIKEIVQSKLVFEEISKEEITSKFTDIIKAKLKQYSLDDKLIDRNINAIFTYFTAVQARFQRHYIAEYKRYLVLGPLECDNYDKIGNEALEEIKAISKASRSKNIGVDKPGIKSAIMSIQRQKYMMANRETIGKINTMPYGKSKQFEELNKSIYGTGGITEDIEYVINLYKLYFNLNIEQKVLNATDLDKKNLPTTMYLGSYEINNTARKHATSFFTCGTQDYYYDDNYGVIKYPWHILLKNFMDLTTIENATLRFIGKYTIKYKFTGKIVFSYKYIPTIYYKSDTRDVYVVYLNSEIPMPIIFEPHVLEQTRIVEEGNFIHTITIDKTSSQFEANTFIGIFSKTDKIPPSKFNVYTGKIFSSRLLNSNAQDNSTSELQKGIRTKNKDKIMNSLNNKKENIKIVDKNNNSVLHVAIILNDLEFLKYLLAKPNAPLDELNKDGYTPLLFAIKNDQFDNAIELVKAGANTHMKFNNKDALESCIERVKDTYEQRLMYNYAKLLELTNLLLEKESKFPDFNKKMKPLVKEVLVNNNIDFLKLFVSNGFDLNQKIDDDFVIHYAIHQQNLELLTYLLTQPLDLKKMEKKSDKFMLDIIFYWKNEDVEQAIDLLKNKGIDPEALLEGNRTYLWEAIINPKVFNLLVNKYNVNVNEISVDTSTILLKLIGESNYQYLQGKYTSLPINEMIETVLKKGADPNFQDNHGTTALMIAIGREKSDRIKTLCSYGADPTVQNNKKQDTYTIMQNYFNILRKTNPNNKDYVNKQINEIEEAFKYCKKKNTTVKTKETKQNKLGGFTRKKQKIKKRNMTRRT